MSIITLDFETYYDKEYSLSKLTTEEYIQDKRFEAIGVGIKVDTKPSVWITGKNIWTELKAIDWKNHALLCQNTMFDAGVLSFRYGILPGFYFDTMLMARAKLGATASVSLKSLAARYGLGVKGEAVHNNIGKRAFDFSPAGLADYGVYCCNDVDLCHSLFSALLPFPDDELRLIDLTLRMYTDPAFHVDVPLLNTRLEEIKQEKSAMLQGLMQKLKCSDEESVRKKLSSNIEFAVCLEEAGVEVPIKISPTTGKETYALAKTDEGFIDLQSHPDIGGTAAMCCPSGY